MKTAIETITPAIAKAYLLSNNNNRPLRQNHIRLLASDIKNGDWQITHQGIAFDSTGRLIDGQHRLHAIIQAGVAIQILVTRGCSSSSFSILDRGANRTPSDIIGWPKRITETISFALTVSFGTNPSVSSIKLMEGSDLIKNCQILLDHCPTSRTTMSSAAVRLAACVQISIQKNPDFVLSQYKALVLKQYNDLTKCSQSFMRQSEDKRMVREELFCRAMFAFDNLEINRSHIIITKEATAKSNEIVRYMVKKHIGNES